MNSDHLVLEPLTAEAFAPFGEVIQRQGVTPQSINYGGTQKFADLARIDTAEEGGETTVARVGSSNWHPSVPQSWSTNVQGLVSGLPSSFSSP